MNGRIKMLIVVAMALIIPSVAVADVMISGSVNITGTQSSDVFYFTPGPNAPAAGGFIGFSTSGSTVSSYMADIDLENTNNMSVFTLNVIQVNFKAVTGTFNLSLTVSTPYPGNSVMYYSTSLMTLADFTGKSPSSIISNAPSPVSGSGISEFTLSSSAGTTQISNLMTISGTSSHIYIGFYVPGTSSISGEVFLTGNFTST